MYILAIGKIVLRSIIGLLLIIVATACSGQAKAETHIVEIRGLEFFPASLDTAAGDIITWVNMDVMPHTATAGDGSWDSGLMETGDEFSLEVSEDTSVGDYVCSFHPSMTGEINMD